ncbi:MAG: helix-turn-helix transcriptional regulator [Clostridia bacterium]|nr:helix-turn-helix transcriptional regulator [Clostridia bacterium]MCI9275143.1 helix-turn-helix transcriptional regulator [Clostridia bacterium]
MKNRLKELREDNDLTQEQCAKIAYISKNSYIRYEKSERIPPLDIIAIYAEYYHTSIDYIAYLTNEPKPYPMKNK